MGSRRRSTNYAVHAFDHPLADIFPWSLPPNKNPRRLALAPRNPIVE
jgi:hypothetical protein